MGFRPAGPFRKHETAPHRARCRSHSNLAEQLQTEIEDDG